MKARANAMEIIGATMVASLVFVAVLAPILAPHDPTRAVAPTYGDPGPPQPPFRSAPTSSDATCSRG